MSNSHEEAFKYENTIVAKSFEVYMSQKSFLTMTAHYVCTLTAIMMSLNSPYISPAL